MTSFQGDSGGPFVLVNSEGRVEVVGLVSWGFKCDSVGMPGVYTKVQFFVDWIKENIQVNNQFRSRNLFASSHLVRKFSS